jgi:ABC-type multidrug transport system ATPase subunit
MAEDSILDADGMAVVTQGLRKRYGARIALDGLDLNVPRGRV